MPTTTGSGSSGAVENPDLAEWTVSAIADAVVTLDAKGVVTSWNPSAESLLGHSAAEARHMAGFHAALDAKTLKHHGRPGRVRAVTAAGEEIPLAMNLGLVRDAGDAVVGVVSVLRPLTELEIFA
jgi:PAS domain S-box-containing protein